MASIQAARTAGFSWDAYARSCADAKIEGLEGGEREGAERAIGGEEAETGRRR